MDGLPLVTLTDATLLSEGRRVFPHTSWSIFPGEHWAILGPNGSGKSTLAKALWDGVPIVEGRLSWPLAEAVPADHPTTAVWMPTDTSAASCVRHVSFDDLARRIARYSSYLQGRYESLEDDRSPTVVQALATARRSQATQGQAPQGAVQHALPPLDSLLRYLGMAHTLDHPLGRLSNGELRKYLVVEALVCRPLLLVLEEPMQGLDRQSRRELARLLRAVAGFGVTLVIVTSRERDVPDLVQHVLRVSGAKVVSQGSRAATRSREPTGAQRFPAGLLPKEAAAVADARKPGRRLIVDLRRVTVRQGGAAVLDRVSWRIREGEAWALTGPNGSGKTTLLSIIIGDHPQAYANDVRVFGRRRGDGQSVWEIKERVGHVSPEVQALFPGTETVEDALLSGFSDSPGAVPGGSPAQRETARRWEAALGLTEAADRPLSSLSDGQKRLVLLARAMAKQPRLLVLDEPCQGLDEEHRALILAAIESLGRSRELSIVYVTHEPREIPFCVDRLLTLHRGRARRRPLWRAPVRLISWLSRLERRNFTQGQGSRPQRTVVEHCLSGPRWRSVSDVRLRASREGTTMTSREIMLANIEQTGAPRAGFTFSGGRLDDTIGASLRPHGYVQRRWNEGELEYYDDEWGNIWVRMQGRSAKGEIHRPVIREWSQMPDLRLPDYSHPDCAAEMAERFAAPKDKFRIVTIGGWVFDNARYLRKLEVYLQDLALRPEEVNALNSLVAGVYEQKIHLAGRAGADGIIIGEDLGTQTGLLFSPTMFRELFKPTYARLLAVAHEYGMKVFMHSCGLNWAIVPDLMDIGVDVFQFDQPELYDMGALGRLMKERRTALWSPVDIQKILPTGDRRAIQQGARRMYELFRGNLIVKDYLDLVGIGVKPEWDDWAYREFCEMAGVRWGQNQAGA